ncbi:MAG: 30S ribosomal protein S20 [Clostridia bacterium]|nr:30S ribosomal protein S20 [Clostridia bacterium]
MPNIKSAKKRVLVSETKALQNKSFKSAYKTVMKKYEAAVASGNKADAEAAYKAAIKKIDTAVTKNIIHKNTAARKKSRYTKMLAAM